MTQQQALRLVCRLVVLYLLFWIVSDLIALPRQVLTLRWEIQRAALLNHGALRDSDASIVHFFRDAIMALASNILRIALWSMLALWFYQGGARLQRFFGLSGDAL